MYALELLMRDSPGILLSPTERETLNQQERRITQSLRAHPSPAGGGTPPPPLNFAPWGSDEQQRFVHFVRLAGADSRSPRELWGQLAHGSGLRYQRCSSLQPCAHARATCTLLHLSVPIPCSCHT